jgi:hypothetical protein
MNSIYLVANSSEDSALLRQMLPPAIRREIQFVVADDPSSAISTARTLLALGGKPVGLVVDAGTTDPAQIASQCQTIAALLGSAAANLPSAVFVAVPDLHQAWANRAAANRIPLAQEIKAFVEDAGRLAIHH